MMKQKSLFAESEIAGRMKAFQMKQKFPLKRLANQAGLKRDLLPRIEIHEYPVLLPHFESSLMHLGWPFHPSFHAT